jgi:hypothetical protein
VTAWVTPPSLGSGLFCPGPSSLNLRLFARKRLQHPHLFLRPRPNPRYLLRHRRSPSTNATNESATIIKQKAHRVGLHRIVPPTPPVLLSTPAVLAVRFYPEKC